MVFILSISLIEAQEIHQAAAKGDISKVRSFLMVDPTLIHSLDNFKRTPLHWACRIDNIELVKLLVDQGSNLNLMDMNGIAPLQSLASRGLVKAAELLIEEGADLNIQDKFGLATPLHMASISGHYQMVVLLIEKGANANIIDKNENTVLHSAIEGKQLKIVEYIISKFPTLLMVQDFDGNTAFHVAVSNGMKEAVELLVIKGANLNTRNTIGETAYNIAQDKKFTEIASFLVAKGADKQPQMFPVLKGNYLGQRKPGKQPEIFLKGIISTSEGIHGTVAFSPDNKEVSWTSGSSVGLRIMELKDGQWTKPRILPFIECQAEWAFGISRKQKKGGKTRNPSIQLPILYRCISRVQWI